MSQTVLGGNLRSKFAKVLVKVPKLKTDGKNPFHKSKYVTLTNLIEVLNPLLHEEGLVCYQPLNQEGDDLFLDTVICDVETGEFMIMSHVKIIMKDDGKNPVQDLGGGISYMRRYTLMSVFFLVAEDDDGQGYQKKNPVPAPAAKKKTERTLQEMKGDLIKKLEGEVGELTLEDKARVNDCTNKNQLKKIYGDLHNEYNPDEY